MVQAAWDYPWSSAAAHLSGKDDRLVKVEPMLGRVPDWREYLAEESDAGELKAIRRHNRTGRPLGDETFISQLEQTTGRELRPHKTGPHGPWKDRNPPAD
jgi:putative transposase